MPRKKEICTATGLVAYNKHSCARIAAKDQTNLNGHIYRATGRCEFCDGFHIKASQRKSGEKHGPKMPKSNDPERARKRARVSGQNHIKVSTH